MTKCRKSQRKARLSIAVPLVSLLFSCVVDALSSSETNALLPPRVVPSGFSDTSSLDRRKYVRSLRGQEDDSLGRIIDEQKMFNGNSGASEPMQRLHPGLDANRVFDEPYGGGQGMPVSERELQNVCILPAGGFFGSFSAFPRQVEFAYQATATAGTSVTQVASTILPTLERAMVEGILPVFFQCPEGIPYGDVIGISTQLEDLLTDSVDCISPMEGDCYTFQGRLTIFGPSSNRAAENLILPAIQSLIQETDLSILDSRLSSVMYVIPGGDGLTSAPPAGTPAPAISTTAAPAATTTTTPSPTATPPAPTPVTTTSSPVVSPTTPSPVVEGTLAPALPPTLLPPTTSPNVGGLETPTLSPTSASTFGNPTGPVDTSPAPSAARVTPAPAPSVNTRSAPQEEETGLDKMEWWAWLLVAVGGLLCCLLAAGGVKGLMGSSRGGGVRPMKDTSTPKSPYGNSADAYEPPAADDPYVPPGIGGNAFDLGNTNPADTDDSDDDDDDDEDDVAAPSFSAGPPMPVARGAGMLGTVGEEVEYGYEADGFHDEEEGEWEEGDEEGEYEDGEEGEYEDGENDEEEGEFENGEEEYEEEGEWVEGEEEYSEYEEEFEEGHEEDFEEETIEDDHNGGGGGGGAGADWGKDFVSSGASGAGSY